MKGRLRDEQSGNIFAYGLMRHLQRTAVPLPSHIYVACTFAGTRANPETTGHPFNRSPDLSLYPWYSVICVVWQC